ncbi:MAG: hypothetical protein ABEJ56_02180 [Candidatus Nanohaloarchaea archaeon]
MKEKARGILEQESIKPTIIEKISEDAGRMKNIFRVQTEDRGEIGVYMYKQPEVGKEAGVLNKDCQRRYTHSTGSGRKPV